MLESLLWDTSQCRLEKFKYEMCLLDEVAYAQELIRCLGALVKQISMGNQASYPPSGPSRASTLNRSGVAKYILRLRLVVRSPGSYRSGNHIVQLRHSLSDPTVRLQSTTCICMQTLKQTLNSPTFFTTSIRFARPRVHNPKPNV